MPAPRQLFASIGSVTVVTGASLAAYLVAVLLLGRALTPEAFGYLNLWVYALNLLGAASLVGFPNALLRHVSRDELGASAWPRLAPRLGAINLGVCAGGALVFGALYAEHARDAVILGIAAAFLGHSLLAATLLQIFRRFALAQLLYTLWRPVLLAGTVALLLGERADTGTVFLVAAAGALAQWGLLQRALRSEPRGGQPIPLRRLTPDALVFSALYVSAILITRLDSFFLPRMLDLGALGTYSAVSFLSLTAYNVLALAAGQVLNPLLASRERVPLGKLALIVMAGGLALGAILTLSVNPLIELAFAGRYPGDHRAVAAALCLAGTLQVLYAIPSSRIGILASSRVLRLFVGLSLSSVAVDAGLLLVAVPRWGLAGAALATALTWAFRAGLAAGVAHRTTRLVTAGPADPRPA
jgi:O-antigen/teichoic acid export membrane protein